MIPQIHLRRGKEESLLRRHPWIFSGAIESVRYDGNEIPEGALVDVYTRSGDFIARGHYQIGSIAVRVLTFEQEPIDAAWWQRMISTALDVLSVLPKEKWAVHGLKRKVCGALRCSGPPR